MISDSSVHVWEDRDTCLRSLMIGGFLLGVPLTPSVGQAVGSRPVLSEQVSGTDVLLQAVSPVNEHVVWASGRGGTFVHTTDGGRSWAAGVVPDADSLQFRDVHAVDERTAYLMSSGPGELSRIYKTNDAGRSWKLQFVNDEPSGFYDCMDFWDPQRGLAYGDAVDGQLRILETDDGGVRWRRVLSERLPAALPGEGGFAASGTCLVTRGSGHAWIGTGAGGEARVLRTADGGRTWSVVSTPVVSGSSTSGIMSLAFFDAQHGVALGGELADPRGRTRNVAVTRDGGRTWRATGATQFPGPAYGAAVVPGMDPPTVVAVGPGGVDYSHDGGRTWVTVSDDSYWSVAFAGPSSGWAVGPDGRITHIRFR